MCQFLCVLSLLFQSLLVAVSVERKPLEFRGLVFSVSWLREDPPAHCHLSLSKIRGNPWGCVSSRGETVDIQVRLERVSKPGQLAEIPTQSLNKRLDSHWGFRHSWIKELAPLPAS